MTEGVGWWEGEQRRGGKRETSHIGAGCLMKSQMWLLQGSGLLPDIICSGKLSDNNKVSFVMIEPDICNTASIGPAHCQLMPVLTFRRFKCCFQKCSVTTISNCKHWRTLLTGVMYVEAALHTGLHYWQRGLCCCEREEKSCSAERSLRKQGSAISDICMCISLHLNLHVFLLTQVSRARSFDNFCCCCVCVRGELSALNVCVPTQSLLHCVHNWCKHAFMKVCSIVGVNSQNRH